uniref:Eukaryotic translation initiation factor 3 subunit K n=1 Tax=Aotus nancymaae TaxID=37293 RepID=A0A2K5DID0_AOTNA
MVMFEQMRANLGKLLKGIDRYNPGNLITVTVQILLKALTNLPHTDFTLCKCMIDQAHQEEWPIQQILYLGDLLETSLDENMDLLEGITGFEDSIRKFICHVVGITYQHIDRWLLLKVWMSKYGWSTDESGQIFICSQEESINPKTSWRRLTLTVCPASWPPPSNYRCLIKMC